MKKKIGFIIVALLLLSLLSVQALSEGTAFPGQYVELDNGTKIWVSKYGEGEKAIVFFAGFGSYSPELEFIPMIEDIIKQSSQYTVYVYDYPGTGYSGEASDPRTMENITGEINETMEKLGIQRFTPIVHSLSGAYLLYYVNQYPEQIDALICIDNSVPEQTNYTDYEEMNEYYDAAIAEMSAIDWSIITPEDNPEFLYLPDGYEFTNDQLVLYLEFLSKSLNPTFIDELNRIQENLTKALGMHFPDDLSVLMMVSTQTQEDPEGIPEWHELHEALVTSDKHEMIIVQGTHYLHYDARSEITSLIIDFLNNME